MFSKFVKLIALCFCLHVALFYLARPNIITELERTTSSQEVERLITDRWNATRNHPLAGSSPFRGKNMHYHGSETLGLKERSILGTFVFVRVYNTNTGEIDENGITYWPSVLRSLVALIAFSVLFWSPVGLANWRKQVK
ncbi:MAG: hypothetical protein AAGL99_01980 [Pseudomonadota bacterium]